MLQKVILLVLILLSISSGITKVMLTPQELEFFGNAGFSETLIIMFGLAQLVGGILLIIQKTRILGAIIIATTFVISTALIFMDGKIAFGFFSIIPILMLVMIIRERLKRESMVSG